MVTKRELKMDLDAVVRPQKMIVAEALAIPNPRRALLAVYQNIDRNSALGKTIALTYEAMLKINSSGVPIMFLEWSPAEVSLARTALLEVGATEAVGAIDKIFKHLRIAPELDALPDEAVDGLLSEEFEHWKRDALPEPPGLADMISDKLMEYVRRNVGQL